MDGGNSSSVAKIAGVPELKGLVLYAASLSFAALYVYFIVKISAATGAPPKFDSAMVSAGAGLAGVLGSAFALEVGITTPPDATNQRLSQALKDSAGTKRASLQVRKGLSLAAISTDRASWPTTFGIWVYAVIAAAVAITYALNQNQTPEMIKALAIAFGGYVVALIAAAYRDGGPSTAAADAQPQNGAAGGVKAALGQSQNGGPPAAPEGAGAGQAETH